jgi:hypothetical protein
MFRAVRCLSSGGLIVSMQHLISSLSVGDHPVHRLTGAQRIRHLIFRTEKSFDILFLSQQKPSIFHFLARTSRRQFIFGGRGP